MIPKQLKIALKKNDLTFNYNISSDFINHTKKEILEILKTHGFIEVNKILVDFLCYFLDKELLFINSFNRADNLHFKLKKALKISYAIKAIERDFDLEGLIPFGMLYREHMELFIDKNDKVYANMDNILIHFGNEPFEALTNILNNKELERIEI
ncbi:hypothetical protein G1K75_12465 [Tenacibaculum finnmarkense]|uniref:SUKH-3 domain-containing protein n=1 Tax=Tenacibaculum finnmarkense TaxID=2781243 RepID=UPI00187BB7FF|nr:SUKH-3 domain-containing protein [Tenacibaculum finnmarkense]MBE7649227.1 hypothetical protein [Tenacibaculum finnmarkense genomovar ulcerans]MCG8806465.1 hypothetical protein [Tenacibaculum finnmarkense]MCG8857683.1 hypothetical protein [Tenacibaculum finnmarkense]WCC41200.1 SUKH-3 domain-containing protein [Tenacibaculum finnmarkense]